MSSYRACEHALSGKECSDITYIPVRRGFLYLVAIMDWATRKVLAWRLSNTLDASFCVEALNEAIAKYGNPEIMNTDQGSQFTGATWITTLGADPDNLKKGLSWEVCERVV